MSAGPDAAEPAVLILVTARLSAPVRPEVQKLDEELIRRTLLWAETVAPGAVSVGGHPAGQEASIRELSPANIEVFSQEGQNAAERVPAAVSRVFRRRPGPLLVVWPELPRWRTGHAQSALGDLAAGCQVTIGPLLDGGLYLFGLSEDRPDLLALAGEAWRAADALAIGFRAAQDAGLEVGFLRTERGLRQPADVQAALADPLLAPELRALLEPAAGEAGGTGAG